MKNIIYFLSIAAFACAATPVIAQPNQSSRTEIEIDNLREDFSLIPTDEYGFILFSELDEKTEDKEAIWSFRKFDTSFKEIWKETAHINKKYYYRDHYYDRGKALYLLFGKYKADEYQLLRLDVKTNNITRIDGIYPKKYLIDRFKVQDDKLYIGGHVKKDVVAGYVDIKSPVFKVLPAQFKGETVINDIEIDDKTGLTSIIYSNYSKRTGNVFIELYDNEKKVHQYKIRSGNDNNLLSGKISKTKSGEELIFGTYSIKKGHSTGLYISKLANDQQKFINFYHFGDFNNFFNYMSERKQEKIEKKKKKKKEKGKHLNLNYNLLVHDVIERKNEFVMVAEAYYATYRSEPYTTTVMVNGMAQTRTSYRSVFDGWVYTHGVIAAFDQDGRKLWDNTFPMQDIKTYSLRKRITVNETKDNIELVYGSGRSVKSMIIKGNEIIQEKTVSEVKPENEDDKVKRAWVSNIEHWYGDNFLVWGVQKIKNKEDGKRKVFFFSKLNY